MSAFSSVRNEAMSSFVAMCLTTWASISPTSLSVVFLAMEEV